MSSRCWSWSGVLKLEPADRVQDTMSFRAIAAIAAVLISVTPPASAENGRHSQAPTELSALEFLVGDWELTTSFVQADGSRRQSSAELHAEYALGGFGIVVEETHGYALVAGGVFVSSVLYSVHPESRRIVGASNNTLGNRKFYDLTIEAERIVIVQSGELFDGRRGYNRHTLFNITPDRYELRLDACREPGDDCQEGTYSYVARRLTGSDED